jgi:hypothetical protein
VYFLAIYLFYQLIASNVKSMTATCTNFCLSIGGGGPLFPLRRADRDTSSARSRTRARHGAPRCGKMRFGGAPPPPSFSPSLSKSELFSSKLFQRKLWPFCGISMGCKASKPKVSSSKYFVFSLGSKNPSHAARPMGIVEGTSKHASMDAVFPKEKSSLPVQCAGAGARRPGSLET